MGAESLVEIERCGRRGVWGGSAQLYWIECNESEKKKVVVWLVACT
jgi:hypothetical protein